MSIASEFHAHAQPTAEDRVDGAAVLQHDHHNDPLSADEWRDDNTFSSDTRMTTSTAVAEFRRGTHSGE